MLCCLQLKALATCLSSFECIGWPNKPAHPKIIKMQTFLTGEKIITTRLKVSYRRTEDLSQSNLWFTSLSWWWQSRVYHFFLVERNAFFQSLYQFWNKVPGALRFDLTGQTSLRQTAAVHITSFLDSLTASIKIPSCSVLMYPPCNYFIFTHSCPNHQSHAHQDL